MSRREITLLIPHQAEGLQEQVAQGKVRGTSTDTLGVWRVHTTTESRQGFHINRNRHCYTLQSLRGCHLRRSIECIRRESKYYSWMSPSLLQTCAKIAQVQQEGGRQVSTCSILEHIGQDGKISSHWCAGEHEFPQPLLDHWRHGLSHWCFAKRLGQKTVCLLEVGSSSGEVGIGLGEIG